MALCLSTIMHKSHRLAGSSLSQHALRRRQSSTGTKTKHQMIKTSKHRARYDEKMLVVVKIDPLIDWIGRWGVNKVHVKVQSWQISWITFPRPFCLVRGIILVNNVQLNTSSGWTRLCQEKKETAKARMTQSSPNRMQGKRYSPSLSQTLHRTKRAQSNRSDPPQESLF